MKAKLFLSKTLLNVTPSMHKTRRLSLLATIESAVNGASVTGLGRDIDNKAKEKHRIKRVDRLCNNINLQSEINGIYSKINTLLISHHSTPMILVDWSDLDDRKQHFFTQSIIGHTGPFLNVI